MDSTLLWDGINLINQPMVRLLKMRLMNDQLISVEEKNEEKIFFFFTFIFILINFKILKIKLFI